MKRELIIQAINEEVGRAYKKHGADQWGRHEFYGILKEEVDELWAAIKTDAGQADVEEEARHVAAMVVRYLETGDRYREPAGLAATEQEAAIREVICWAQATLTALNVGDVQKECAIHRKLREVMIAYREATEV